MNATATDEYSRLPSSEHNGNWKDNTRHCASLFNVKIQVLSDSVKNTLVVVCTATSSNQFSTGRSPPLHLSIGLSAASITAPFLQCRLKRAAVQSISTTARLRHGYRSIVQLVVVDVSTNAVHALVRHSLFFSCQDWTCKPQGHWASITFPVTANLTCAEWCDVTSGHACVTASTVPQTTPQVSEPPSVIVFCQRSHRATPPAHETTAAARTKRHNANRRSSGLWSCVSRLSHVLHRPLQTVAWRLPRHGPVAVLVVMVTTSSARLSQRLAKWPATLLVHSAARWRTVTLLVGRRQTGRKVYAGFWNSFHLAFARQHAGWRSEQDQWWRHADVHVQRWVWLL